MTATLFQITRKFAMVNAATDRAHKNSLEKIEEN